MDNCRRPAHSWRMPHPVCRAVPLLFAFTVTAQDPAQPAPAKPQRSQADALVRQVIEREQLAPPRLESGLELGAGKGPLVLLVRHRDGSFALQAVARGGDEAAAEVQPPQIDLPQEIELTPAEEVPEADPKAAAGPAKLRFGCKDGEVEIGTDKAPQQLRGKAATRSAIAALLREQTAVKREPKLKGQLQLAIDAEVPMQDVLTTLELARAAGFTVPMFEPRGRQGTLGEREQQQIAGLAEQFGWKVELKAGVQPIASGELLILLDGPVAFGDVAPLMVALMRAGIWQFGFVGQQDAKARFKLPTHLPVDRGL